MTFIETSLFSKILPTYLSDDEYRALQSYRLQKPDAGDIVKGSGGVRKVRWAVTGKGKSGGIGAIYYWKNRNMRYGCSLYIANLNGQPSRVIF